MAIPTAPPRRRFLDWRFLTALGLLLSVSWLVFSGLKTQHDDDVKAAHISQLVTYTQQQAAEFLSNRNALLADQGLLVAYTHQLAVREDALLQYLRSHGIQIPQQLITEIAPPILVYPPAVKGGGAGQTKKPSQRRSPALTPGSAKQSHGHFKRHHHFKRHSKR